MNKTQNTLIRPTWVEVDMNALAWNVRQIKKYCSRTKLLAVVKADAYGLGAIPVARLLLSTGVDMLGVVMLDEALELRAAGITAPILNMGEILPSQAAMVIDYDIEQMAFQDNVIQAISQAAMLRRKTAKLHFKIDTGMSRYGVPWHEALLFFNKVRNLSGVSFVGAMSHFAMSDAADKSFSLLQLQRFNEVKTTFINAGVHIPRWHICNSGGTLNFPEAHFDMVRVGLMLYGYYPSEDVPKPIVLQPAMSVKTKIIAHRTIEQGVSVGYGRRFIAEKTERIGVCPVGYSDGYNRRLRNVGQVILRGSKVPILGGLCMDACFIKLTDVPDADSGDVVTLMGMDGDKEISPHEIAAWIQSVSYDVMSAFGRRLPRVYVRDGVIVEIKNYLLP